MSPAKKAAPKPKTLAETLSALRKKNEPIGSPVEVQKAMVGLSTGNLVLDALTGIGGLPVGRITELTGPPSSGKTTCALQTAAGVQQAGGNIVFLDYEYTLDLDYCQSLGIDTGDPSFIYMQPLNFEHGADTFRELLATGEVALMVADSVAAMVTKKEIESSIGTAEVMERAKLMHKFCRQIAGELNRTDCAAVFLNHVMDKTDLSPMGQKMAMAGIKQKTSPGGKALPFYSSLRMEFAQMGNVREKGTHEISQEEETLTTATRTKATVIKNKVGDPFRTAELRVHYGKGFSQQWSVLQVLVSHGVIKKNGGSYKYPEDLTPPFDGPYLKESRQVELMEAFADWGSKLEKVAVDVLATKGLEKVDGSQFDEHGLTKGSAISLSLEDSENLGDDDLDDLMVDTVTGEIS